MAELTIEQKKALALAAARKRAAEAEGGGEESYLPRAAGLGVRGAVQGAVQGVLGIPGLALDAVNSMRNWGPMATNAMGLTDMPLPVPDPFKFSGDAADIGRQAADVLGTPTPETAGERLAVAGVGGAVGAGVSAPVFGGGVVANALAGAGGGLGAQGAAEAGFGPVGQIVGGVAGSVAPAAVGAAGAGAANVARRVMRGTDTDEMAARLAAGERLGVNLSAGQASPGGIAANAEGFASNVPGGRGVIDRQRNKVTDILAGKVDDMTGGADEITAGRAITRGIEDDFMPKARATRDQLYATADQMIPGDTRIGVREFAKTLDELTGVAKGAVNTGKKLNNPWLMDLRAAIEADTGVPITQLTASRYDLIRSMRTQIGRRLEDPSLITDVPRGQLKRLYGALMRDVKGSLTGDAKKALNRADWYNRALHDRADNFLDPIMKRAAPEDVFNATLTGSKEGGTKLRVVMRSLPEAERKIVAKTVIDRLGRAVPSVQDETGRAFSIQSFGTNWAKLSPVARSEISAAIGPDAAQQLEDIAKVAATVKAGTRAGANPSGTGINTAYWSLFGGAGTAVVSGSPTIGAGVATAVAVPYLSARLFTSPGFVRWLAATSKAPAASAPAMVQALRVMAENEQDDEVKADYEALLGSLSGR